ncbi:hypothetical protein CXB51_036523 [Gossypium anomalum]|uniref:RNase H type-1 domain-containing protein n=1 Tax=Gossypium anomalum TaxID=47600 RepID=A0A8J5XZI3_9ROSI|nr:hypothetical protein CXB51_036523 [Gossypium anomalum]
MYQKKIDRKIKANLVTLNAMRGGDCGVAFEGKSSGGGVMRDEEGIVRALFSGPSDTCDAESVELGAIITAMDVFTDIGWKGSCSLIVEMGSRKEGCARKLSFTLAEAGGNEMADALASAGMSRPCLFKAWCHRTIPVCHAGRCWSPLPATVCGGRSLKKVDEVNGGRVGGGRWSDGMVADRG